MGAGPEIGLKFLDLNKDTVNLETLEPGEQWGRGWGKSQKRPSEEPPPGLASLHTVKSYIIDLSNVFAYK